MFPPERQYDEFYLLNGDTVINGTNCTKMYCMSRSMENPRNYLASLYEVGEKVFIFDKGKTTAELLYDFGLKVGEQFIGYCCSESDNYKVTSVETICVNGTNLRRLNLTAEYDGEGKESNWWVENIGSSCSPLYPAARLPGNYEGFISCTLNDKSVTCQDMEKPSITAISPTINNAIENPFDIYTTSGVLVRHNATDTQGLKPGVYIVNKNKIIIK